jgi:GH35 family endo-1,4-beta-xylanase
MHLLASHDGLGAFELTGEERHLGALELAAVDGKSFDRALRVTTGIGATQEWRVCVSASIPSPMHVGDVVLARFWMRRADRLSGQASAAFAVESTGDAVKKLAVVHFTVGDIWAEYFVPFHVHQGLQAEESRVSFWVGYDRQTLEIGGLELINYGTTIASQDLPRTKLTYSGRQQSSDWRAAAAERIERHRKANLLVDVVDANGTPLAGATVEAVHRRHAFGFGTAVCTRWLNDPSDDGQRYRHAITSLFNRATFENAMKWPAVYNGVPPSTDQAVEWLRQRHIDIRGHNLLWPSWRWLPKELHAHRHDVQELRRRIAAHIFRTASHFAGKLIQWDVVNEPYSERDLLDLLGRDALVEWFKLAREADPRAKLFINDYGIFDSGIGGAGHNEHADHIYDTLWFLRERGAPVDGIGIQSHFAADLPPPEALLATLDRFSQLGLPIESTEVTINLEDHPLQADYLRDYMTVLFSHPNVYGMTVWGFWTRQHWRPLSAFFDDDWAIRPMGQAYNELVNRTWRTQTSSTTNAAGRAVIRGFCGTYELTVRTRDGRSRHATAQLNQSGDSVRVPIGAAVPRAADTAATSVVD